MRVKAYFPGSTDSLFVERLLLHNTNIDEVYGGADSLISSDAPYLLISNFSKIPIVIGKGQTLGYGHNPDTWLDKLHRTSPEEQVRINVHANLIQSLLEVQTNIAAEARTQVIKSQSEASSKASNNLLGKDDPLAEPPLEGGPKTAETSPDPTPTDRLLDEVHISPDLSPEQKILIEGVILRNQSAFGLDGRLGSYDSKVDIILKEGAEPVSLPPFSTSPANREVIDKQMDA